MIKISCPVCNQEYEVENSMVGQIVECMCHSQFYIEDTINCKMCCQKVSIHAKKCPYCRCWLIPHRPVLKIFTALFFVFFILSIAQFIVAVIVKVNQISAMPYRDIPVTYNYDTLDQNSDYISSITLENICNNYYSSNELFVIYNDMEGITFVWIAINFIVFLILNRILRKSQIKYMTKKSKNITYVSATVFALFIILTHLYVIKSSYSAIKYEIFLNEERSKDAQAMTFITQNYYHAFKNMDKYERNEIFDVIRKSLD